MATGKRIDGAEAAKIMYGGLMPETNVVIKSLAAPWERSQIKWRVGSINKAKDKALPLAYVDARDVMERLDSAVGVENWQDRYEFHGNRIICYLSIRINGEWICKSDGAGDSAVEAEKGGISDAFKRAVVKWGVGRELYELKCRWQPINEYKQLVGDSWDYVIKGAAQSEPKKDEKKELTPGQKRQIAEDKAREIDCEYRQCKSLEELQKVQAKHNKWLVALSSNCEDLFANLNTCAAQVLGGFDDKIGG